MAKAKAKKQTKTIVNRRARHDYELGDSFVAGLQLTGAEVKNLRMGHGQLRGAYVTVKDGELWLLNATISGTAGVPMDDSDKTRTRKLLIKKRELAAMIAAKQQGRTLVPTELLVGGRFIKVRIAVGRGKKAYDKRQTLKARSEQRSINTALKSQR